LVGVIDDQDRGEFFGVPLYPAAQLPDVLEGEAVGATIIIMSLAQTEQVRADLARLPGQGREAIWV
jgi:hypothetical protein